MRIRDGAALLLLLSGLTACAVSGSPGGKTTLPGPSMAHAQPTDKLDWHKMPTSPLTYFATNGKTVNAILNQISNDVDSCMTGAGFEYHPNLVPTDGIFAMQTPEGAIEQARTRGYAVPKRSGASAGAQSQKRLLENLKGPAAASYLLALDGRRSWQKESDGALSLPPAWATGCAAKAARRVLGGMPVLADGVREEISAAFSRVDKSRELTDSVAKWSRCMHSAGVTAASPADAVRLASKIDQAKTTSNGLAPKSIAIADATCSADTTKRVQQRLEYGELLIIASTSPAYREIVSQMAGNAQ